MPALTMSLAPQQLWQAINPWTFYQQGAQVGCLTVNLGQTPRPDIEQRILDRVGSYGRQLGHLGDALAVLLDRLPTAGLDPVEAEAVRIVQGELAEIRRIKRADADAASPPGA